MNTLNKKISNKNHGLVLEVSNYSYITGTSLSLSLSLTHTHKLQALVYNILPSTTARFSY